MPTRPALLTALCLLAPLGLPTQALAIDASSPYGINTHIPSGEDLDLVAQAGIGWVRMDFNWFQMEPNRDQYAWGTFDSVVNAARARGLNIFATLAYTPGWANGNNSIQTPPTNVDDWRDFVADVVGRYKGSIKHWGMWNEPDLDGFYLGTPEDYIDGILIPGYETAKAVDPSCLVLGPELAHLDSSHWAYWLYTVLNEAGDYIDIVTHHNYSDTGDGVMRNLDGWLPIWERPSVRGVMAMAGAEDKPLWLTETGWHTDEVSEDEQADYYDQILDGVLANEWLDKVFFYELKDDPNIEDKWGILRSDRSPKEAYYRYQQYIAGNGWKQTPSLQAAPLKRR